MICTTGLAITITVMYLALTSWANTADKLAHSPVREGIPASIFA